MYKRSKFKKLGIQSLKAERGTFRLGNVLVKELGKDDVQMLQCCYG